MTVDIIVGDYRANAAHEVGKSGDRGPGNNVIGAGILPYPHGANRHSFHGAGQRADGDQVAGIHPVLKLDKYAGDNIFNQRLRAKRNRQP